MRSGLLGIALVAFSITPVVVFGQLRGTQNTFNCIDAAGNTVNENLVCERVPVTCDGKEGEAISRCKAGKCIATEACNKPLEGLPEQQVESGGSQSNTTPPVLSPETNSPQNQPPIPSGSSPMTLPSPGGTAGGSSGGTSVSPESIPPVEVEVGPSAGEPVRTAPAGNGTTFTPISIDRVSPGTPPRTTSIENPPGWGNTFSDGDPFYSGSTFGPSMSGGVLGSPLNTTIGTTLMGSVLSFLTNLFIGQMSNTSGVSGNSDAGANASTMGLSGQQQPRQVSRSIEASPPLGPRTATLRGKPIVSRLENNEWRFYLQNPDGSLETVPFEDIRQEYSRMLQEPIRNELDELSRLYNEAIGSNNIAPLQPQVETNRASENVEDRRGESQPSTRSLLEQLDPYWRLPAEQLVDVYRFTPSPVRGTANPPLNVPEWWTPELVGTLSQGIEAGYSNRDAYNRARTLAIESAFAGLAGGRLAPGVPEVNLARELLQEDVRIAERQRDAAHMSSSFGFMAFFDRMISLSSEQIALDRAQARLESLVEAEGRARLGMFAYTAAPTPVGELRNEDFVRVVTTPLTLSPGYTIDVFNPATWTQGSAPETSVGSYNLLTGLSAIAASAVEETRDFFSRVTELSENPPVLTTPPAGFVETSSTESVVTRPVRIVQQALWYGFGIGIPESTQIPSTDSVVSENPPFVTGSGEVRTEPLPETSAASRSQTSNLPPIASAGPPSSSQGGQVSRNPLSGGINWWQMLFSGLLGFLGNSLNQQNDSQVGGTTSAKPATVGNAVASITATPTRISSGDTTQLAWSSIGTERCAIVTADLEVHAVGETSGVTTSPAILETARFGVVCDVSGGEDKVLNETLVVVEGDVETLPPLFSNAGRASTAAPLPSGVSGSNVGTGQGDVSSPAPIDVRTCDPQLSIDAFIQCLCLAEPNPAGCSVPPGGI